MGGVGGGMGSFQPAQQVRPSIAAVAAVGWGG